MKRGLVLGGGGLVGMAYHAGALQALSDHGYDVTSTEFVVGTSAGSIIASYLASGWSQTEFYEYAQGRHDNVWKDPQNAHETKQHMFEPLWSNRRERVQRSIGSLYALASSKGILKRLDGALPAVVRRAFPSGLYSTERSRMRLREELGSEWPDRPVTVVGVELYSGERRAFSADEDDPAPFADAVLASTAIPGVFPPVRINDKQYVDGGAYSATSLDLAVDAGCESIICVAPLGYRNEGAVLAPDPRVWPAMITRSLFARSLRREVMQARERGVHVLVLRPWIDDLKELGTNAMRHFDRGAVADVARHSVARQLERHDDHPALAAFRKPPRASSIA
jgi:NTE family protein